MKLNEPFFIGSNLQPAIKIAGATISIWPVIKSPTRGKPMWAWEIELPSGQRIKEAGLFGYEKTQGMMATLLDFLCACAESRQHRERMGRTEIDPDDNEGMFPPSVAEWSAKNSDEIACLRCEIEETKNLIEED